MVDARVKTKRGLVEGDSELSEAGVKYHSSKSLRLQYFRKQDALCGLCLKPVPFEKFEVHHDHSTGECVCGVCISCNKLLARNGDDLFFLKMVGLRNVEHRTFGWNVFEILAEETAAHDSDWAEVNKLI